MGVLRATAVVALLGAGVARADQEVVELRYQAPAGCPARAAFEAEILGRTPNVRLGAPAHRRFAVTIEATADGFRGALVVDQVADKELAAERCDDLASALALVTALAIDPSAVVAPRPPGLTALLPAWSFELGVDAIVSGGVGPEALFGAMLEGRASVRRFYAVELAAILGRDTTAEADAQARFTWLAGLVGGCRSWQSGSVVADACGHLELGAVRANGQMIINHRDLTRLWLAAGVHGSARYPADTRVFGQLQIGASAPVLRDRYIFAPNVAIHETPSLTGWLVVGVGVRFL